jgi:Holliday junction resolvasome RuvABC endonuclease subunit
MNQPQLDHRTARILSVDPGTIMGACFSDGKTREWEGCDLRKRIDLGAKLLAAEAWLRRWLQLRPEVIVFEDAAYSKNLHGSAQGVLAAMRGLIEKVASEAGLPCIALNPSTLKAFAGCCGKTTRRDKEAMVRAAARLLDVTVANHNEADAVWLEALARHRLKAGVLFAVPKAAARKARRKGPQGRLFR